MACTESIAMQLSGVSRILNRGVLNDLRAKRARKFGDHAHCTDHTHRFRPLLGVHY